MGKWLLTSQAYVGSMTKINQEARVKTNLSFFCTHNLKIHRPILETFQKKKNQRTPTSDLVSEVFNQYHILQSHKKMSPLEQQVFTFAISVFQMILKIFQILSPVFYISNFTKLLAPSIYHCLEGFTILGFTSYSLIKLTRLCLARLSIDKWKKKIWLNTANY